MSVHHLSASLAVIDLEVCGIVDRSVGSSVGSFLFNLVVCRGVVRSLSAHQSFASVCVNGTVNFIAGDSSAQVGG